MMASTTEQYQTFDVDAYLRTMYSDVNVPDRILFRLECLHKAYQSLPSSLKVLDYGAGPVVLSVVSAADRASEIVLSDVAEVNREALRKWLQRDPAAFNWSPYFDYVVQKLEGKGEKEAREREEKVRQLAKNVVHSDINEEVPVQEGFEGPYDVVMDSWCLLSACSTREIYEEGVAKLSRLLKPGGTLMLFASQRKETGYYIVGSSCYQSLQLSGEYVTKVVRDRGLTDISLSMRNRDYTNSPLDIRDDATVGYMFITAKKQYK